MLRVIYMTLQQLRYIIMVAEKGSINEASKALFISQPSLTNAIKELEKEMNITIFHRTHKGVILSHDGDIFLSYARQVIEQADLLESQFTNKKEHKSKFSVSCQHYSFAVNAFVDVIQQLGGDIYDFTLRETQTYEIIEDVSYLRSEIGVLYTCQENETVIMKMIQKNDLLFEEIFVTKPHVFISSQHPLAHHDIISLDDLKPYPYLSFEQGKHNSFFYSEEVLSTIERTQNIKVRDRATLFNLLIGLNGYTISSGVISKELNGENIISKPLDVNEYMRIGFITHKNRILSPYAQLYKQALRQHIQQTKR